MDAILYCTGGILFYSLTIIDNDATEWYTNEYNTTEDSKKGENTDG